MQIDFLRMVSIHKTIIYTMSFQFNYFLEKRMALINNILRPL